MKTVVTTAAWPLTIRLAILTFLSSGAAGAPGQGAPSTPPAAAGQAAAAKPTLDELQEQARARFSERRRQSIVRSEEQGIEVRIKDISRFRGVRSNQIEGYGLVVGLNGSGDTTNTPFTSTLVANVLRSITQIDPASLKLKNIAVVSVSSDLPPFAAPGNRIDVNVASVGDATSLQGGYLLRTPLYGPSSDTGEPNATGPAYAVAMGPISIGGFSASSAGSSVAKNHPTAGHIPEIAIVEKAVNTQVVFDGKMYLELQQADFTTAQRMAEQVNREYPEYQALALDGGNVMLVLPPDRTPVQAMSEIEEVRLFADTPATVVISETTGTIVMGGNVRIGPAVVAKGSLTVKIMQEPIISQPNPFTSGTTEVVPNANVSAKEEDAHVMTMGPTTSVADLAAIFGALKVSATDIIAILEALREQGALKAEVKIK